MPQTNQSPHVAGLGDSVIDDKKSNTPNPAAVQAAIADLRRDFISECLRIAAVKSAHGADNLAIGDDLTAERDISLAVDHLREGARAFRELQRALGEVAQ